MFMPLSQAQRARFATRTTWTSVLGLLMIPILIGGLLTWALWEPSDRMNHVTAAIVNEDEPVTVDGQLVPLGRQLAAALVTGQGVDGPAGSTPNSEQPDDSTVPNVSGAGLTTTFDWTLSDQSDATAGLADGTYDVVVTIPQDFSAAATSSAGDADLARQATFTVETSPFARPLDGAIAQVLGSTAAQVAGSQLTEAYLENVLLSFSTMSDQLGQASDGATELAAGARTLTDGTEQLGSGTQDLSNGLLALSDGQYSLAAGLGQLSDGATDLSGGLGQLSAGTNDLATGLDELSTGANQLSNGLNQLAAGTQQGADQATAAIPQAQQFADGLGQSAVGATQLSTGFEDLITAAQGLAAACTGGDPDSCIALESTLSSPQAAQLLGGLGTLSTELATAAAGAQQLADGTADSATALTQLASAASQSAAGADQVAGGVAQSAAGAHDLASGTAQSAAGAGQLAAGASQALSGAMDLADGASQAAGGANDLVSGVHGLTEGATQLTDGVGQLATGLDDAVEQIPTYTDTQATSLAAVIATPVAVSDVGPDMLGTSSVPYFMALALWLGALATYLVLAPLGREALGSPESSVVLAWRTFWPAAGIGVGQAAVLTAVMGATLKLDLGQWIEFGALAAFAAVVFTAVNHALAALLGNIGRFVSVVVAVTLLATAVISTVPPVLTGLAAMLPTAPLVDGLRAVVNHTEGLTGAWTSLVLWGLVGFGAAIAATARTRVVDIGKLTRWAHTA